MFDGHLDGLFLRYPLITIGGRRSTPLSGVPWDRHEEHIQTDEDEPPRTRGIDLLIRVSWVRIPAGSLHFPPPGTGTEADSFGLHATVLTAYIWRFDGH